MGTLDKKRDSKTDSIWSLIQVDNLIDTEALPVTDRMQMYSKNTVQSRVGSIRLQQCIYVPSWQIIYTHVLASEMCDDLWAELPFLTGFWTRKNLSQFLEVREIKEMKQLTVLDLLHETTFVYEILCR